VGSVADGLSNYLSDVNLLTICGDSPTNDVEAAVSRWQAAGPRKRPTVRIRSCDKGYVDSLLHKLARVSALIHDPRQLGTGALTKIEMLNKLERALLHSLRTGIVLANAGDVEAWRNAAQDLADFLIVYHIGVHFNCREDAIAQVKYGDPISALWMLIPAADSLSGAMLASVGETHPDPKWRPRLLLRHQNTLGKERVERVLKYLLPSTPNVNANAVIQFALRSFDVTLLEILARRPAFMNPMLEFRKQAKIVIDLDEIDSRGQPRSQER
jgi:hypothetical protein